MLSHRGGEELREEKETGTSVRLALKWHQLSKSVSRIGGPWAVSVSGVLEYSGSLPEGLE